MSEASRLHLPQSLPMWHPAYLLAGKHVQPIRRLLLLSTNENAALVWTGHDTGSKLVLDTAQGNTLHYIVWYLAAVWLPQQGFSFAFADQTFFTQLY